MFFSEILSSVNTEIPIALIGLFVFMIYLYSSSMERQVFNRPVYFLISLLSLLLFYIVSASSFTCHISYVVTIVLVLVTFLTLFLFCRIEVFWSMQ